MELMQHTVFTCYKICEQVGTYPQFLTFLEKVVREDFYLKLEENQQK